MVKTTREERGWTTIKLNDDQYRRIDANRIVPSESMNDVIKRIVDERDALKKEIVGLQAESATLRTTIQSYKGAPDGKSP